MSFAFRRPFCRIVFAVASLAVERVNAAEFRLEPIAADAIELHLPANAAASHDVERRVGYGAWMKIGTASGRGSFVDGSAQPGERHQYRLTPHFQIRTGVVRAATAGEAITLPLAGPGRLTLRVANAGDNDTGDHAVWVEPVIVERDGSRRDLTSISPTRAKVGWRDEHAGNYNINGKTSRGLWAHAPAEHVFQIDAGASAFRAVAAVAGSGPAGTVVFSALYEPTTPPAPLIASAEIPELEPSKGRATYYVDGTSGDDTSAGTTEEKPFRSLAKLGRLQLSAGDKVLLRAGQKHNGRLSIHGSGTSEAPIIIGTFGGDEPATVSPGERFDDALVLIGSRHVKADGLRVELAGGRGTSGSARAAVRVRLDDLASFDGIDLSGLHFPASADGPDTIALEPISGNWDLAHHAQLDLRFAGGGNEPATVSYRIENVDAGALRNCVSDVQELPATKKTSLRLPIVVRPLDPGFAYFAPYFMYVTSMDVRDGTIDPREVRRVAARVEKGKASLEAITLSGRGPSLPKPFFPFIDEFGQYIHGHWPGKVYAVEDLSRVREQEARELKANAGPADWNEFGGWSGGPQLEATGNFRTEKVDGKWWLVDPKGRLFFSHGPTGVGFGGDVTPVSEREFWFAKLPPREGDSKRFWRDQNGSRYMYYERKRWSGVDVVDHVLQRKYGEKYEATVVDLSHQRLRSWGFNTIANWSDQRVYLNAGRRTPYTVALHPHVLNFGHHHDVFDPDFRNALRDRMEAERSTTANDPWNLGYFVDNELKWGPDADGMELARRAVRSKASQPAKQEMRRDLEAKYADITRLNEAWGSDYASWDAWLDRTDLPATNSEAFIADSATFGRKFAETYFAICRDEVKRVAPKSLYLGCRFHGHIDPTLMAIAGRYSDVLSYNIYDETPNGRLDQYLGRVDKPFISSEWGFGSDYRQTPFGRGETEWNPQERPDYVSNYMKRGLIHPLLVGTHFFQYRDQPMSGRDDGEAILRGFVNSTDTPHEELVRANRLIAAQLYRLRSGLKSEALQR